MKKKILHFDGTSQISGLSVLYLRSSGHPIQDQTPNRNHGGRYIHNDATVRGERISALQCLEIGVKRCMLSWHCKVNVLGVERVEQITVRSPVYCGKKIGMSQLCIQTKSECGLPCQGRVLQGLSSLRQQWIQMCIVRRLFFRLLPS